MSDNNTAEEQTPIIPINSVVENAQIEETKPEPVKTGEFYFQFFNEDAHKICDIFDHSSIEIKLPSPPIDKPGELIEIDFEKNGKKLRLFTKNV